MINLISPIDASSQSAVALILDVRNPDEYEECHIPGSALHPLGTLDTEAVQAIRRSGQPCFVLCAAGMRARKAVEILSVAGHENLSVIEGGIQAWMKEGLPVIKKI
jgi:rhodanese-related sulfurtransferase